ncbi:MAG: hypothetical protein ABIG03_04900 [Candidatus Eisenbacteria bacterium]
MVTVAVLLLGAAPALADVAAVDGGIEFTYDDPYAGSVHLAGDFNGWSTNATPLEMDEEGVWRVVYDLKAGSYEYKFVVNGSEWIADPSNPVIVGDYGNSGLTVDENGELAASGGVAAISNTTVNSRVKLTGWYRATYETQSDVPSDPRWRLTRPEHEFYVSVDPTVNKQVTGSGTIRLSTGAGDIKEIHADIYSGHLTLGGGPFSVTGWYNEELVQFDNPLQNVGHIDLAGTIPEEHVPFGRGAQGVNLDTGFWDIDIEAVYANSYDLNIWNDPGIYDNADTDLIAARAKRPVGPATLGVTYAAHKDGWWMSWQGTNESSQLDDYIAESGSSSDWFELSNTEQTIGLDVALPLPSEMGRLGAEYAALSYDGLFDMGNREKVEGEDYSNGAIDVPFGSTDGWAAKGILDVSALEPLDFRLEATRFVLNGMSADEEYVAAEGPTWWSWAGPTAASVVFPGHGIREYTEVRYAGSPLVAVVFGPLPEYESTSLEIDAGFGFGIFDLGLELDHLSFEGSFIDTLDWLMGPGDFDGSSSRVAASAFADVLPEKLGLGFDLESLKHELNMGDELAAGAAWSQPLDTVEAILHGRFQVWEEWGLLANLRAVTYRDVPTATAARDSIEYKDETFFTPYIALVYSPRPNIEVRLGYGVDPLSYLDTPVEGRGNGRERWRSQYLWEHSAHGVIDAEEALEDARTIGLMAVISF